MIEYLIGVYKNAENFYIINAIKVGFIAGLVRVTFFKKGIRYFFAEWVLAAFVVYIASKVLPHYFSDVEFIAGASAALGFLAREILQLALSTFKGFSPKLVEKLSKLLE